MLNSSEFLTSVAKAATTLVFTCIILTIVKIFTRCYNGKINNKHTPKTKKLSKNEKKDNKYEINISTVESRQVNEPNQATIFNKDNNQTEKEEQIIEDKRLPSKGNDQQIVNDKKTQEPPIDIK